MEQLIEAGRPGDAAVAGRMLPGLARLRGYGYVVDVAAVRAADLQCGMGNWRRPSLLHGAAKEALHSCISGEGEPPLRLTIAAVACAGSGVVCGIPGIPVQQLREDSVTELNLSDGGLHVPAAMLVASLLPVTSVLKNCNLLQNKFDVELAKKLAKIGMEKGIMLSGMTRDQTEANFSYKNLQSADAILIASDLQLMAVLTELNLRHNSIGPEGAIAIAEALKVNTVLTELWLNHNKIGPEGAIAVAEALKVNAVVTTLFLGVNNIGVEGAKAIAEALKVNAVLTVLSIFGNNMGGAGTKAVRDAVKDRSGFELML